MSVTLDVGSAGQNDYGHGVAIYSDDKIIIVGPSNSTSGDYTVAKYTSTGGLDSSFGTSGVVSVASGAAGSLLAPLSVALQSSDKIIVAASIILDNQYNNAQFDVVYQSVTYLDGVVWAYGLASYLDVTTDKIHTLACAPVSASYFLSALDGNSITEEFAPSPSNPIIPLGVV